YVLEMPLHQQEHTVKSTPPGSGQHQRLSATNAVNRPLQPFVVGLQQLDLFIDVGFATHQQNPVDQVRQTIEFTIRQRLRPVFGQKIIQFLQKRPLLGLSDLS